MRSSRATGFCVGACQIFSPRIRADGFPDGFHLLAAIDFLHQFVVEGVAGLFVLGGPDEGFGGVGEVAAGEIGRRIGLDPGNVVEELEAELLHGEATEWMTWEVPETQMEPLGLRTRCAAASQERLNSWLASGPRICPNRLYGR